MQRFSSVLSIKLPSIITWFLGIAVAIVVAVLSFGSFTQAATTYKYTSNGSYITVNYNGSNYNINKSAFSSQPGKDQYQGVVTVNASGSGQCTISITIHAASNASSGAATATKGPDNIGNTGGASSVQPCSASYASSLSEFNGTISISGSTSDTTPAPTEPESPGGREATVRVYSKVKSPPTTTATLTITGKSGTQVKTLSWSSANSIGSAVWTDIDAGSQLKVCISPWQSFDTQECKTATKQRNTPVSFQFGSAETAYNENGKKIEVTVNTKVPAAPTNTTVGPIPLTLINTDGNTGAGNTATTARTLGGDNNGPTVAQSLALIGVFDNIEPGTYKVCVTGHDNWCSATFTKAVNSQAKTTINLTEDQTKDLLAADRTTTCAIDGIGWIVCPLVTAMSVITDSLYGFVQYFLEVQPLNINTGASDNTTYVAWSIMRNIANIAFVIAFLIIIYSQLTGVAVSNYGVKKLLPRLVIAAILVNVSYWIAALAVDISNIIGNNLYTILRNLPLGKITVDSQLWETVFSYLLAGGAVTGAIVGGALVLSAGTGGAVLSAIMWAAIVLVLGALLSLIVAFLIMAIRQALIIILIVISPLAFVAFLLPNTEKFFSMWRKSLTTLLIFYPLFSLLFGGSFIAGMIIIGSAGQTTTGAPTGLMLIVGMAVMILPLFLTPMLIRFSSGIMGTVAGMVNNKSKGLIDRARNVRNRKASLAAHETMGHANNQKNPFSRIYRKVQNSGRTDAQRKKIIESDNQGSFLGTSKAEQLAVRSGQSDQLVNTLDSEHKAVVSASTSEELTYRQKLASEKTKLNEKYDNNKFTESLSKTQPISANNPLAAQVKEAREVREGHDILDNRGRIAEGVLQQEFAEELRARPHMQNLAGGIDPNGSSRVVAQAIEAQRKASEANVAAYTIQHKDQGIGTDRLRAMAENKVAGENYSSEEREAASRAVIDSGNIDEIKPHLEYLSTALTNASTTEEKNTIKSLQKAVGERIGSSAGKPMGLGPVEMEALRKGEYEIPAPSLSVGALTQAQTSALSTANAVQTFNTVVNKGVSAQGWASIDKNDIKEITDLVKVGVIPTDRLKTLQASLETARSDPRISTLIKERETKLLSELETNIASQISTPAPVQTQQAASILQIPHNGAQSVHQAARTTQQPSDNEPPQNNPPANPGP